MAWINLDESARYNDVGNYTMINGHNYAGRVTSEEAESQLRRESHSIYFPPQEWGYKPLSKPFTSKSGPGMTTSLIGEALDKERFESQRRSRLRESIEHIKKNPGCINMHQLELLLIREGYLSSILTSCHTEGEIAKRAIDMYQAQCKQGTSYEHETFIAWANRMCINTKNKKQNETNVSAANNAANSRKSSGTSARATVQKSSTVTGQRYPGNRISIGRIEGKVRVSSESQSIQRIQGHRCSK